jgi:hypothetical protein
MYLSVSRDFGGELFPFSIQSGWVDTEDSGGLFQGRRTFDDASDVFGLDGLERDGRTQLDGGGAWAAGPDPLRKIVRMNESVSGEDYGSFDGIAQFTEVARP